MHCYNNMKAQSFKKKFMGVFSTNAERRVDQK